MLLAVPELLRVELGEAVGLGVASAVLLLLPVPEEVGLALALTVALLLAALLGGGVLEPVARLLKVLVLEAVEEED